MTSKHAPFSRPSKFVTDVALYGPVNWSFFTKDYTLFAVILSFQGLPIWFHVSNHVVLWSENHFLTFMILYNWLLVENGCFRSEWDMRALSFLEINLDIQYYLITLIMLRSKTEIQFSNPWVKTSNLMLESVFDHFEFSPLCNGGILQVCISNRARMPKGHLSDPKRAHLHLSYKHECIPAWHAYTVICLPSPWPKIDH